MLKFRDRVYILGVIFLGVAFSGFPISVAKAQDVAAWRDLMNRSHCTPTPDEARRLGGFPAIDDIERQEIWDASSDRVNLDNFAVRINRLPPKHPDMRSLFHHIRRNFADFLDEEIAEFDIYPEHERERWRSQDQVEIGSMAIFRVHPIGAPVHLEQLGVIATRVDETSWTFTTVSIGGAFPGDHPVSGHREFGFMQADADGTVGQIYTRGADRALDRIPPEGIVYDGGQYLWESFQERIRNYVEINGGSAEILEPMIQRPYWSNVRSMQQPCISLNDINAESIDSRSTSRESGGLLDLSRQLTNALTHAATCVASLNVYRGVLRGVERNPLRIGDQRNLETSGVLLPIPGSSAEQRRASDNLREHCQLDERPICEELELAGGC